MTRFENRVVRVLSLVAGAVLLAGFPGHPAQALEMSVSGIAPAYQVGRHDSQNRFCYDGSCIIHGKGKIDINVDPEANSGGITATFTGSDGEEKAYAITYLSQQARTEYTGYSFAATLSRIVWDYFAAKYEAGTAPPPAPPPPPPRARHRRRSGATGGPAAARTRCAPRAPP